MCDSIPIPIYLCVVGHVHTNNGCFRGQSLCYHTLMELSPIPGTTLKSPGIFSLELATLEWLCEGAFTGIRVQPFLSKTRVMNKWWSVFHPISSDYFTVYFDFSHSWISLPCLALPSVKVAKADLKRKWETTLQKAQLDMWCHCYLLFCCSVALCFDWPLNGFIFSAMQ